MKGNNWGGKRAGAGRKNSLFERKPLVDAVRRRTEEAMLATLASKGRK